jgi:hypothetical protein
VEEMLLSRRKNELSATIRALDDSILKLWHHRRSRGPTQATVFCPLRTLLLEITLFPDDFSSYYACEPALALPAFFHLASNKKSAV